MRHLKTVGAHEKQNLHLKEEPKAKPSARDYADPLAEDEYFLPEKYYELEQQRYDATVVQQYRSTTAPRACARETAIPQTLCHCGSTLIPEGATSATHPPSTTTRVHHHRPGIPCRSEPMTR